MAKIMRKSKKKILRQKILDVIAAVNTRVIAMEEVVWGCFLAMLSGGELSDGQLVGEHLFMIGEPGVGKSYVMDVIMSCMDINPDDFFDYLLHQFSTPDEILGSTDVKKFMEEHVQRRDIEGYLPSATFAVMDEIWKSGPVTTALFKITNERRFKNGREVVKCPLITMLSASNEYPSNMMDAPLWDRILFRYKVEPVEGSENWSRMYDLDNMEWNPPQLTIEELLEAKKEVNEVEFTDEVKQVLQEVHVGLARIGIKLSPRRRKKQRYVIMANAWLNGRDVVKVSDIAAIVPTCWNRDEEISKVKRFILKLTNHTLSRILEIRDVGGDVYDAAMRKVAEYERNKSISALEDIDNNAIALGALREELVSVAANTDDVTVSSAMRDTITQLRRWHGEILPYAELVVANLKSVV